MMTTPVITVSGAPSARVARDWPIDSRSTLPPPKTASSPARPGPPLRSSVISMSRSVWASRIRSPVVGPNSAAYLALDSSLIVISSSRERSSAAIQFPRRVQGQAVDLAQSPEWDERDMLCHTGFEAHRGACRDVEPITVGCLAVERQRRVGLRQVHVAAHLNRAVAVVHDVELKALGALVER